MNPSLQLSVVIVSYNTCDILRRCLSSMLGAGSWVLGDGSMVSNTQHPTPNTPEVVVVDNASADGSADMVEREFQGVRVMRAQRNLGFARAANVGLAESHGDLLLLLNPDTEVVGDALGTMAGFLAEHGEAAAVGPALLFPDGSPQHAAFRFPSLWMSLFDFFPLNHRIANSRLNGRYPISAGNRPLPVDHLLGAAIMVRRNALEDVGPLDESFFMYCEEVDWCLRASRRGWKIYHLPSARIIHHSGQSTRQFSEDMFVELHRSRYLLFRKHYSQGFLQAHRGITRLGLLWETARALRLAREGRLGKVQLQRRLWAYRTVWSM